MALTAKQRRFVREFLVDRNATQAAIRAGFSAKTAREQGHALRGKPEIQTLIREAEAQLAERTEITQEMIIRELALIGFANMQDYLRIGENGDPFLDFSKLTREQAAPIVEVTVEDFKDGRGEDARDVRRVKFKLADKKGALVDLGKHLGMFKERVEHSGHVTTEDINARADEFTRRVASRVAAEGAGTGAGDARSVH